MKRTALHSVEEIFLFIVVNYMQSEVRKFVVDIMKLLDQLTGCFVYL